MLSIGKLAAGAEEYYLSAVAAGVEDYYLGPTEAPGRWTASAHLLGLTGQVDPDQLRAVLAGRHPGSGEALAAANRRRAGFDLTFSAPKSASLLWALGGPDVSAQVIAAHEDAVDAALGWLEQEVGTRGGHNGVVRLAGGGLVAAGFGHRGSRAGDPQVHTHVLVANLTPGPDGRWRALDGRALYAAARTAGFLYEAELRAALMACLGVAWKPVRRGLSEMVGVPEEMLGAFSRRRVEIEAALAERGESSARAAQVATLDTRAAKNHEVGPESLAGEWRQRAESLGFGHEQLSAVVHTAADLTSRLTTTLTDALSDSHNLARRLTEEHSSFDRYVVLRELAEQAQAGASVAELDAATDTFLASEAVVAVGTGRRAEMRWSTPELLELESVMLEGAARRQRAGVARLSHVGAERAVAQCPGLGTDQAAMVKKLLTSGAGVEVVVGPAGTGKTFALAACRAAWEQQGLRVIGAALAARAAAELQAGSGIASATLDSLLAALDDPASGGLVANCVVVVDEAGMVGTRKLARLLSHGEAAGAKVVLLGDHRQLPEIAAGGAFRALGEHLGAVELTENRRQRHQLDRFALAHLRHGRSNLALAVLARRDSVVTGPSGQEVRRQMVADWARSRAAGEDVVMLATTRASVADLNRRARALLTAAGELHGPSVVVGGSELCVGDRVMTTRNRRRLGVVNGARGVVTRVDPEKPTLVVRLDTGDVVVLSGDYLASGHVVHAYASTVHKAQGMTCDRSLVLADDRLFLESSYTALSRGREANALYVVSEKDKARQQLAAPTQLDDIAAQLRRSMAKELATETRGAHIAGY